MQEKLKCDHFKAQAMWMVPFCESEVPIRWVYNDIIDHVYGVNIKSEEELKQVMEYYELFCDTIGMSELGNTILPTPEKEGAREIYRTFHKEVFKEMEACS